MSVTAKQTVMHISDCYLPRLGGIEELEVLRKALTDDEFESARRHLLAG